MMATEQNAEEWMDQKEASIAETFVLTKIVFEYITHLETTTISSLTRHTRHSSATDMFLLQQTMRLPYAK